MMSLPKTLGGRYEAVRRVGTGGMADVYLARDSLLGRRVALKVLHPQYANDKSFVERFRREARAAANLQHANVVSIYDWGHEENLHFIVMEFVEGRSLKDVIAAEAPLDPRTACSIAAQVLAALDFAHRAGIVHRDVKPGNILITQTGEARVADFGIARAASGSDMTQTGTILGTAYYVSPEQAQGLPVDARSDCYSVGVVLYEMVTGKRPFEGESPVEIALRHVRDRPQPPSSVKGGIPAAVETIVLKALAKQPGDRYQTAAAMRSDLRTFLQGRQITTVMPAQPDTAEETQVISAVGGPRRRPAPKRPGWLLALALTLLVGGLALGTWSLIALLRPAIGGAEVPSIVGRGPSEAELQLRQRGLTPSFQGNEPSDSVEEGKITRQRPDPKRRIAQGSAVKYWVSSGLPFVTMPSLKGLPLVQARRDLTTMGLTMGQRFDVFNAAPAGTVIEQSARAGDQVRKGTSVDLTISRGPETGAVPDVVGETAADAATILANQGFRVARADDFSDAYEEGRVFQQDPESGARAETGSTVTIYVSRGPQTFAMPNVTGETEAAARAELQSRGLSVETRSVTVPSPSQRGRVVGQSPGAGTMVRRDETVTIEVGQ